MAELLDQGIIVVNKDKGVGSTSVVRQMRKLLNSKRVGHCGTLDPFASGVLPIAFGRATKAVAYMSEYDKVYRCQVQLGARTDTLDRTGEITQIAPDNFNRDILYDRSYIEEILKSFEGEIKQQAPLFSAVKVDGKALYKYARAGKDVKRPWRKVKVYEIELLDIYNVDNNKFPRLDLIFRTGKGTYIRSLADSIGEKLGCFAHAAELERRLCGSFHIEHAITMADLTQIYEQSFCDNELFISNLYKNKLILPTVTAFSDYPVVYVEREEARRLSHGQNYKMFADDYYEDLITIQYNNVLIALASVEEGIVKVKRVFIDTDAELLR